MSKFRLFTFIFGFLWLVAASGAVVWARDPIPDVPNTDCTVPGVCSPTRPVRYMDEVFVPAVQSQDVNLQSTVFEIFLSLLASMRSAIVQDKCDAACQADFNKWVVENPNDPRIAEVQRNRYSGLLPELTRMNLSMVTQPPVSSVEYIAHVGQKLHLTTPAYAQGTAGQTGFGYEGLAPVRNIWTAFRNIAYLLATVGFIILSFMIMFRVKISAQMAIGAQQAITKLVVVFLAITFSYAIAGLMVDLAFVLSFVIISLFTSTNLIPGQPQGTEMELQRVLFSGNILHSASALIGVAGSMGKILDTIFANLFTSVAGSGQFVNFINRLFSNGAEFLGTLIVAIALIYSLFKLLFQLAVTFVEILFLTILAPLMILPDILPGNNAFMGWIRRIFANVMVFPVVTFMLLLGMAIVGDGDNAGLNIANQGLKMPYLAIGGEWITPFLGVIVLTLLPKAVDMVKNTLKVSAFPYSAAVGAALGYGLGRTQALGGAVGGFAGGVGGAVVNPFGITREAYKGVVDMGQRGIRSYTRSGMEWAAPKIPIVGNIFARGAQSQANAEKSRAELIKVTGTDTRNKSAEK